MPKASHLAIVISDLRGGGTQRVLSYLLDAWSLEKTRISLITLAKSDSDFFAPPKNIKRYILGTSGISKNKLTGFLNNFKRIIQLKKILKTVNPDTAIGFITSTNIILILASIGLHIRVIISERNDPARQSCGKIWNFLRKLLYRYADIVTANSTAALETMKSYVPQKKLTFLPNPIFLRFETKKIAFERPSIITVGRLHYQKAYDVLLKAFADFHNKLPNWQLVILGEGELKDALMLLTRALSLEDHVVWKGQVADPLPYYKASDIFAMPSRYEGMPNALLEAISCGLPVIITNTMLGALDYVKHDVNGLIVPVEDEQALSKAFYKLASDDRLREAFGKAALSQLEHPHLKNAISLWNATIGFSS